MLHLHEIVGANHASIKELINSPYYLVCFLPIQVTTVMRANHISEKFCVIILQKLHASDDGQLLENIFDFHNYRGQFSTQ